MEYYSKISRYKSINSIIGSFYSDFFDGITMIMRPVIGGIDYLHTMHRTVLVQKEIDKISHWNYETREKFLDVLTDIVSTDVYDAEFIYRLEAKLSGLEEFNETFKQLDHFATTLDRTQLLEIIRLSLNKLNGRISSIRNQINLKIWDKNEDASQLFVLDQILYLTEKLIDNALRKKTEPGILALIVYVLLKIEAFYRGKITLDDFQDYISELSFLDIEEEPISKNYSVAFDALAV